MSIVRPCLRLTTVAALRDRTWAESRVLDSDNAPLESAIKTATAPYIVVYTDDDDRNDVEGFDVLGATRTILLVVEFGIAGPVEATSGGTTVSIPATDAAFEIALDMIETQIINALIHDPRSSWGAIWRSLAMRIDTKVESKRGGSAESGVRWAARQLLFHIETIADPPAGVLLDSDHPVSAFLEAARQAPQELGIAPSVDLLESMLTTAPYPEWRQAQAWLGLTEGAVRGIGVDAVIDEPDITMTGLGFDPAKADMFDQTKVPEVVGDNEPEDKPADPVILPEPTADRV